MSKSLIRTVCENFKKIRLKCWSFFDRISNYNLILKFRNPSSNVDHFFLTIWRFKCRGKPPEKGRGKLVNSKSKYFQFLTLHRIKVKFFFLLKFVSCFLCLRKYLISLFRKKVRFFPRVVLWPTSQWKNLIKLIWCLFHHNIRLHTHIISSVCFRRLQNKQRNVTYLFYLLRRRSLFSKAFIHLLRRSNERRSNLFIWFEGQMTFKLII